MFYLTWFFGMFLAIYFAVFITLNFKGLAKSPFFSSRKRSICNDFIKIDRFRDLFWRKNSLLCIISFLWHGNFMDSWHWL